ncbi:hypothetical protein [Salmonirosea aquatica]|uniref:Uncharacterized protein n=1 Tax=Salmonirosea aquatica TaxID=2654236 RepID=A0A7C9FS78_9BACT|nr:hypothetical protein [Cytophagaceae bacterium SJW1-29]MPR37129.1 hypothetical protein [Cytophagaceae bacterium SJW1-29]
MATQINTVNPVPDNYNPASQLPQWMEVGSNFALPSGHFHQASPNREDRGIEHTFNKGVTHFSLLDANDEAGGAAAFRARFPGRAYQDVPRIQDIFNLARQGPDNWQPTTGGNYNLAFWPGGPMTTQQALNAANGLDLNIGLFVGELLEGDAYLPELHPSWKVFIDRCMERLPDGALFAANYFTRWHGGVNYNLGEASRAAHEGMLTSNSNTWPTSIYHPGNNYSATNLIVEGIYLNAPDQTAKQMLQAIFRMRLSKKLGKAAGLFVFDVNEWLPGYAHNTYLPSGVFERSNKAAHNPQLSLLWPFLAHEYGNVSIEWGLKRRAKVDKTKILDISFYMSGKDRFYPSGSSTPTTYPNYVNEGSNYYDIPAFLADFPNFGLRAWNVTGGRTVGGTDYYCDYRINGGNWINKTANGTEEVRQYYDKTYVVKARIKGGQMSVLAYNFWADNIRRTLEFRHPTNSGITYQMDVCGIGPFAQLINL